MVDSVPAAPKSSKKKWLLWGCGGAFVALALLVTVVLVIVNVATAGPEKVVEDFLAAAGSGDYAKAHDAFSEPLKQAQPLAEFTAAAQANAMFFQVRDTTFNNRSVDLNGATLEGTATLTTGTVVPASFKLVKENGQWKLIAYHLGS